MLIQAKKMRRVADRPVLHKIGGATCGVILDRWPSGLNTMTMCVVWCVLYLLYHIITYCTFGSRVEEFGRQNFLA